MYGVPSAAERCSRDVAKSRTPRQSPWISVNPAAPNLASVPGSAAVAGHARTVALGPGDLLYLPALWYHQVFSVLSPHKEHVQSCIFMQVGQGPPQDHCCDDAEEATIAVNAWFDMSYNGPAYAYYTALRSLLGLK